MDAAGELRLLTIKEAAKNLGLSLGAVYALCQSGALAHYRLGIGRGRIMVAWSDLAAFLQRCRKAEVNESAKTPPATDQRPVTRGDGIRPFKFIQLHRPPGEPPASSGQPAG